MQRETCHIWTEYTYFQMFLLFFFGLFITDFLFDLVIFSPLYYLFNLCLITISDMEVELLIRVCLSLCFRGGIYLNMCVLMEVRLQLCIYSSIDCHYINWDRVSITGDHWLVKGWWPVSYGNLPVLDPAELGL